MSLFKKAGSRTPRRVWVQNVDVSVSLLRARLDGLAARRAVATSRLSQPGLAPARVAQQQERLAAEDALDKHIRELLAKASDAANRRDPAPNRLINWWGGRLIEAAYQNLHAAESLMARLYDRDEVVAELPEALARVESGLNREDARARAAASLARRTGSISLDPARAALSKAIEVGHNANDRDHSRLRGFRNAVFAAAALLTALLLAFGFYVAFNHDKVPLCFTPSNAEGLPATWVCPTGEFAWDADNPTVHGPTSPHDVVVVGLLGLLGGAFSAAIAIRNLNGTTTPYDVPLALAVLKVPLGALTSIGLLIALQGDFVPGLSELDSQGQILAYALVFGYAQQLLSGLLDRHAQGIIATAPGKDRLPQSAAGRLAVAPSVQPAAT